MSAEPIEFTYTPVAEEAQHLRLVPTAASPDVLDSATGTGSLLEAFFAHLLAWQMETPDEDQRRLFKIHFAPSGRLSDAEAEGRKTLVVIEGVSRVLGAQIYESEGHITIADNDTGIFGYGDDLPSALRDLRDALHEHLDVLAGSTTPIAPGLQHQLELLQSYFNAP
jgi:hypothetical protein